MTARDRTPIPGYKHPSASAYNAGCGCEPCKAFRRRKAKIVGIYGTSLVDAAPVAARVDLLVAEGFTLRGIAKACGLSARSLGTAVLGSRQTVRRTTSDAVLSVTRDSIIRNVDPGQFVPTIGATRRLRALMFMGWRLKDLATNSAEFHLLNSVRNNPPTARIRAASHLLVDDLYRRHAMTEGPYAPNRSKSKRFGHQSPMAWDDIDDPDAQPDYGNPLALVTQDARERFEEFSAQFRALIAAGRTGPEAAAEMGMTVRAAWKRFHRGAPDDPIRFELTKHIRDKKAS